LTSSESVVDCKGEGTNGSTDYPGIILKLAYAAGYGPTEDAEMARDMNEKGAAEKLAGEEAKKRASADVDVTIAVEKVAMEQALALGEGVQVEFIPAFPERDIVANDTENIRIAAGETIGGVKVTKDLRNIDGMVMQIREVGRVLSPLVVSKREDGSFHLLQGFRRLNAVRRIRKTEKGTPLAESLENVPVNVYSGLTPEQERNLINDQTSKSFNRSEVLQLVFDELHGGYHPLLVAERNYQLIGRVTGADDQVRAIENEPDQDKRKEKLKAWMMSIMTQGWYACFKIGNPYKNLWLQTYLYEDGYTDNPPDVLMSTPRMKKITAAMKADQTAKEWDGKAKTGPRTAKLMAEFAQADKDKRAGLTRVRDKDKKAYRKISETVELIGRYKDGEEETYASRILSLCFKDAGDPPAVMFMTNLQRCISVYREHANYLDPGLKSVLDFVFEPGGDESDRFGEWLMDNYAKTRAGKAAAAARRKQREADGEFHEDSDEAREVIAESDVATLEPAAVNVETGV
jgi:hypothetical protein